MKEFSMATITTRLEQRLLRLPMGEFWSGDRGLTLVTASLVALVFVITPLREAGVPGRLVLELIILCLMVFGAFAAEQRRIAKFLVIAFVLLTAVILGAARLHPTPHLQQVGSIFATITLLLYVRVVLVVMFRGGPVTWSRIQGGVCAYLLLGMAWASAFQVVEQFHPGSLRFVTTPQDFDQLIAKLTYFSFSTLTTVGGDITPVSPVARSLSIAESMAGQLFPAILIGALVAMAMQARAKS
jgi:ion channel